jgi:hypothetical protein
MIDEIKIPLNSQSSTIRYTKHKVFNTHTRYENKYLLFNHAEQQFEVKVAKETRILAGSALNNLDHVRH